MHELTRPTRVLVIDAVDVLDALSSAHSSVTTHPRHHELDTSLDLRTYN